MRYKQKERKRERVQRLFLTAVVSLFALFVTGESSLVEAVNCGDVLTTDVILTANLDCGSYTGSAALTVEGVTLDLNSFQVIGNGQTGIVVEKQGSKLLNGTVTNCDTAVDVKGDGNHVICSVTAANNNGKAFKIRSSSNLIVRCASMNNGNHGFEIRGENNCIAWCRSSDNGNGNEAQGFHFEGSGHYSVENWAAGNAGEGFQIKEGASELTLFLNAATSNKGQGFIIKTGATKNVILGNWATGNKKDGILVENEAVENIIRHNNAWSNGDSLTTFDLHNGNSNCDTNKWLTNWFGTRNSDCIQ